MLRPTVLRWLGLGSTGLLLAGLAACGSLYRTAQREPWRAQVEAQCLASGAVRESAGVRLTKAIEGPGVCGIDHPFRVSSLELMLGGTPRLAALRQPRVPDPYQADPGQPDPGQPDPGQPLQLPGTGAAEPMQLGAPVSPATPGFTPLPDLQAHAAPVQMQSDGPFAVSLDRSVTLSCSMVPAVQGWLSQSVQPAAMAAFGSPVVEMTSFGTYSCRRMDNRRVGRMSEHAYANAIDVKGFVLANGRSVKILGGWRGAPDEQVFWRDIAYGACSTFSTVLGPGASDGQHENHLHLDLARHSSRNPHICRPRVPAGWIPLALRGSAPIANQQEPAYTSSIEEPLPGEDQD